MKNHSTKENTNNVESSKQKDIKSIKGRACCMFIFYLFFTIIVGINCALMIFGQLYLKEQQIYLNEMSNDQLVGLEIKIND